MEAPVVFEVPSSPTPIVPAPSPQPLVAPTSEVKPAVAAAAEAQKPISQSSENLSKVSAFSLASIKAKRELQQEKDATKIEEIKLPKEPFTETDMLVQWVKYANRIGDKGQKIMESLLLINDPKLDGTLIIHELPNESSKHDFESEKRELLGYLRGKLHNHDIDLELIVNESIDTRKAFTPQDRYNRLNEINPNLEKMKKLFDLDF